MGTPNLLKALKIRYHHWVAVTFEGHSDHIAIQHVLALADLEDDWGLLELGYRFSNGISVEQSFSQAVFCYKKSYEQKGKCAQYSATNLGCLYLSGSGVEKDHIKAAKWFEKGADLGSPVAQYNYGLSLLDGWSGQFDLEKGERLVRSAANSGLKEAQEYICNSEL